MIKILKGFFSLILVFAVSAKASTFVGNGGNAGDVELQVTLSQVNRTLSEITASGEDSQGLLCRCQDVMKSHKMCDSLAALNQRQIYYCGDTLSQKAKDMIELLKSKEGVQFVWTSEAMAANEKERARDADAIADRAKNKIYLNREQFLSLQDYERIFLVTHELGHLVQIEKKYLRDDEQVGPFKQEDGGRQLLNSMAAATTMKSLQNGQVSEYVSSLSRSKNYKLNWLSISLGEESGRTEQSTKFTPYSIKKYSGWNGSYRYQIDQTNGVSIGLRALKGDADIFTKTKAQTQLSLFNVQYHYRLFPFNDPLSTFGQSHFILGIGYETGSAEMKLSDDHSDISEKAQLGSPIASVQYFLPFDSGIWFHAGVSVTAHHYEFENIGYQADKTQTYVNLGASYGF